MQTQLVGVEKQTRKTEKMLKDNSFQEKIEAKVEEMKGANTFQITRYVETLSLQAFMSIMNVHHELKIQMKYVRFTIIQIEARYCGRG